MMARVLALLIVGIVLTGCTGGDDSPAGILMVVEIEANPVMGSCRDRWVRIFPTGGDQVTGTAENGIEVAGGTCRYSFETRVEEASSYRFEARDWGNLTLSGDEIERDDIGRGTFLRVYLDFRG